MIRLLRFIGFIVSTLLVTVCVFFIVGCIMPNNVIQFINYLRGVV